MATIESVCEDLQLTAEQNHFKVYVSRVGYKVPVIKICPFNKPQEELLVLRYLGGLIIEKHRNELLTRKHRDKPVQLAWVLGFMIANTKDEYCFKESGSNYVPIPDWSWAGDWRDWKK